MLLLLIWTKVDGYKYVKGIELYIFVLYYLLIMKLVLVGLVQSKTIDRPQEIQQIYKYMFIYIFVDEPNSWLARRMIVSSW